MDKKTRRVVSHVEFVHLENVRFIVSAAGLERVRREQRKQVIAFAEGDITNSNGEKCNSNPSWARVYFNPYKVDTFVVGDKPIYEADRVYIRGRNIYARRQPSRV
jgi:nickel-dependent lactate racemase